jgi:hypothetical protein
MKVTGSVIEFRVPNCVIKDSELRTLNTESRNNGVER